MAQNSNSDEISQNQITISAEEVKNFNEPKNSPINSHRGPYSWTLFATFATFIAASCTYNDKALVLVGQESLAIADFRTLYACSLLSLVLGLVRARVAAILFAVVSFGYFLELIFQFLLQNTAGGGLSDFGFAPMYARLPLLCIPTIAVLISKRNFDEMRRISSMVHIRSLFHHFFGRCEFSFSWIYCQL